MVRCFDHEKYLYDNQIRPVGQVGRVFMTTYMLTKAIQYAYLASEEAWQADQLGLAQLKKAKPGQEGFVVLYREFGRNANMP